MALGGVWGGGWYWVSGGADLEEAALGGAGQGAAVEAPPLVLSVLVDRAQAGGPVVVLTAGGPETQGPQ